MSTTRLRVVEPARTDEHRRVRLFSAHAVRWLHRAAAIERGFVASPAHIARRVLSEVDQHPQAGPGYVFRIHGRIIYATREAITQERLAWACGAVARSALRDKFMREFRPLMRTSNDHNRLARAVEQEIARRLVADWSAVAPS